MQIKDLIIYGWIGGFDVKIQRMKILWRKSQKTTNQRNMFMMSGLEVRQNLRIVRVIFGWPEIFR